MALDFPTSPALNQVYTFGSYSWRWDGTSWVGAVPIVNATINNTTIGAVTPSTGAFTSLTSTSGAFNGTVGASTPSTVAATTITAQNASFQIVAQTSGSTRMTLDHNGTNGRVGTLDAQDVYIVRANVPVAVFGSTGLNSTAIGATAASTGAFTTLSATGAYGSVAVTSSTGTNGADVRFTNTGGTYYVGVDSSTGGAFGATAYDMIHFLPTGRGLSTVISGSGVVTRVSSTGLAVTGALSAIASGGLKNTMTGSGTGLIQMGTTATDVGIRYDASTVIGCVTATESAYCSIKATAFTVSSDQRIKKNITDYTDSGTLIDSIRPRRFDIDTTKPMHADGKAGMVGIVAQEAYEIFPQAVTKGDENEEIAAEWGVDYSQFVGPMLAELKSLRARVAALESLT